MAEVLVLVDETGGEVAKSTFELLTAARRLGEPSAVVVGAPGTAAKAADPLGRYGAEKVYAAESEDAADRLVTPEVDALAAVAASASPVAVLVPASARGKEVAARLAVRLGSGLLVDAVDVDADATVTHSVFGGAFTAKAKGTHGTPVISLRGGAVDVEEHAGAAVQQSVEVSATEAAKTTLVTGTEPITGGDRPELTEASVVVSGGRGVGSAEQFEVVEKLADSLGAAVGASRAAVDSGYYPQQFQVGQTGKTVSPQLYIALGISGAIQHRAGMQTSKTIIAVNKDSEAPIFEISDYGVVGDLFKVAPQLTEEVDKRKA
jgi:electron transfer flavoprotein alpha subunit